MSLPIEDKIATIAREIYGADGVEFEEAAKHKIEMYTKQVGRRWHNPGVIKPCSREQEKSLIALGKFRISSV